MTLFPYTTLFRSAPLYDVVLAAPGLDPSVLVGRTRTVWDLVSQGRSVRPVLVDRVERLLQTRGGHRT